MVFLILEAFGFLGILRLLEVSRVFVLGFSRVFVTLTLLKKPKKFLTRYIVFVKVLLLRCFFQGSSFGVLFRYFVTIVKVLSVGLVFNVSLKSARLSQDKVLPNCSKEQSPACCKGPSHGFSAVGC